MDIQPDYSSFYNRLNNTELLDILENPRSYQRAAIEAAKAELSNRQLSEDELTNAKNKMLENQLLKEKKVQKRKKVKDGIDKKRNVIIASFNPNQKGISKTEKSIRFIITGLGALFLYQLMIEFSTIQFYIKYVADMPLETVSVVLPILLLPVALVLFWKRSTTGWRLLAIWLTFSILESTAFLLSYRNSEQLNYLVQTPSISGVMINLVILCGALYTICQSNIREEFNIERKNMTSILVLTVVLSLLFSWMIA